MVALANLTLSSAQSTVTFSSISGTYRDLRLIIQGRSITGADQPYLQFNGDTANNYGIVAMEGNGSATSAYAQNSGPGAYTAISYNNFINNADSIVIVDLLDYSTTNKRKTVLIRSNSANQAVAANANRWANTSAITSIAIKTQSYSFAAGTSFALYGVSSV